MLVRKESQELRNELHTLRSKSQVPRNVLILRNKLQVHRSESLTCKNYLQIQTLKSQLQKTNEPQKTFINNESQRKNND